MKKIYTIEDIPENEKIYLSKDRFGWRVVHPVKNEDGTYNVFNLIFGSWSNILLLLFILFLLAMFYFAYHEVASQLSACVNDYNSKYIIENVSSITKLINP